MASHTAPRLLVELAPHSVQLALIGAGGKLDGLRECAAEAGAVTAALAEIAPGGKPANVQVLMVPATGFVMRAGKEEAASIRTAKSLLARAESAPHGLSAPLNIAAFDGTTGQRVDTVGSTPWVLAGVAAGQLDAAKARLDGLGLPAAEPRLALPVRIGAVVTALQDMPEATRVLVWQVGETDAQLACVSASGCEAAGVTTAGFTQIFEAVQAGLGLKFRAAATKLFFNAGYDFSETAGPVAERLAAVLRPAIAALGCTPTALHVAGLPAGQVWLEKAVAEALELVRFSPDMAAFCAQRGLSGGAVNATLPESSLGVLYAASTGGAGEAPWQPVWLDANAPAPAPAAPAPKPAAPAGKPAASATAPVAKPASAPAQAPAPAPVAKPEPVVVASAQPKAAPVAAKPAAAAAAAPAPAVASAPAAAAVPAAKPVTPAPVVKPAAPAPATVPAPAPVMAAAKVVAPEPVAVVAPKAVIKEVSVASEPAVAAEVAPMTEEVVQAPKKKPVALLAAIAAVVVLGGAGIFFMTGGPAAPVEETAPAAVQLSPEEILLREQETARMLAEELKTPRSFRNDRYSFEVSDRGFLRKMVGLGNKTIIDELGWLELQGMYTGSAKPFNAGTMNDADYKPSINKVVRDGKVVFEIKGVHPRFSVDTLVTCMPASVIVETVFTPVNMDDPRGPLACVYKVAMNRPSLSLGQNATVEPGSIGFSTKSGTALIKFNGDVWGRPGEEGKQSILVGSNLVFFHFTGKAAPKNNVLRAEFTLP